ncbi:hypothetical protein V6N13_065751 [Hibiscus sabdariffa]
MSSRGLKLVVPPEMASNKNKVTPASKTSRDPIIRKPLTVNLSDFPVLSRFASKASSSRLLVHKQHGPALDITRHSTTIMKENIDPNVVQVPSEANGSSELIDVPILGDPPDLSLVGGQSRDPGDQLDPPNIPFSNPMIPDIVTEAGCGDYRFLPTAKQFLRDNKLDVVVFVEPRICGKNADSVISLLGFRTLIALK